MIQPHVFSRWPRGEGGRRTTTGSVKGTITLPATWLCQSQEVIWDFWWTHNSCEGFMKTSTVFPFPSGLCLADPGRGSNPTHGLDFLTPYSEAAHNPHCPWSSFKTGKSRTRKYRSRGLFSSQSLSGSLNTFWFSDLMNAITWLLLIKLSWNLFSPCYILKLRLHLPGSQVSSTGWHYLTVAPCAWGYMKQNILQPLYPKLQAQGSKQEGSCLWLVGSHSR